MAGEDPSIVLTQLQTIVNNPMAKMLIGLLTGTNGSLLNFSNYDRGVSLNTNVQNAMDARIYGRTFGAIQDAQIGNTADDFYKGILRRGFGYSDAQATAFMQGEGIRLISNLSSSYIFNQANQSLSNIHRAVFNRRYIAGAGADGVGDINRYANAYRGVGERILNEHYVNRAFGSLDISDVGDIVSTLVRTGKYDNISDSFGNTINDEGANIEQIAKTRAERVANDAKQYSKALSTLKDTIGGSVKDVITTLESMFNTSVGSLSPQQLQNMANSLTHTMTVTGKSVQQLAAASAVSFQYMAPYGGSSMLATQTAANSMYHMTTDPRTYGISKQAYEAQALAAHTNKVLSGDVRYMAAAYQAWADNSRKDANKAESYQEFLREMQDSGVSLTKEGLNNYMLNTLGLSSDATAQLLNSRYVGRYAHQFNMTTPMFEQQANAYNKEYEQYLKTELYRYSFDAQGNEIDMIQQLGGMDTIAEMTDDDLRRILMDRGVSRVDAERIAGMKNDLARRHLGYTMSSSEAGEFMRQSAQAARASRAQLYKTGVLSVFRDTEGITTAGGLEGLLQSALKDSDKNIGITEMLSVGMLGIDLEEAKDKIADIQAQQGAAGVAEYTDDLVRKRYEALFGKPKGGKTPSQQEMRESLRQAVLTTLEEDDGLLDSNIKSGSNITHREYQKRMAKGVDAFMRLKAAGKNKNSSEYKQAIADLKEYANDKDLETNKDLLFAIEKDKEDLLFTEEGRQKLAEARKRDNKVTDFLKQGSIAEAVKRDKNAEHAIRGSVETLASLSKDQRKKLMAGIEDGSLDAEDLKAAGITNPKQSADILSAMKATAAKGQAHNKNIDMLSQMLSISETSANKVDMWERLFSMLNNLIEAVKQ